jgi:hypothetical protein
VTGFFGKDKNIILLLYGTVNRGLVHGVFAFILVFFTCQKSTITRKKFINIAGNSSAFSEELRPE